MRAPLPHVVLFDLDDTLLHFTSGQPDFWRKEARMRPIAGAMETLAALRERGHRLALLTNGCSNFQRRKLARFRLEPLFELILIEGELGYGKPDRRVFEAALRRFEATAGDACMIGDNLDADIAGAQALGIAAIWFDAHGTGSTRRERRPPERIIQGLSELLWADSDAYVREKSV